ncbi:serine hydrolase [Candidatus Kryptonium thompsonii]|uniref:serine hydrolase n=1 Tax=Candidatus Kryptonium thompsonii TaxID=1633631 RepID=UPI0007072E40|nr:serine hydrolase [Candidatus Kryptonium thompsoni]CUS89687.1 beta-lactamase class A [Candidatus Kryptonium thompsoni]
MRYLYLIMLASLLSACATSKLTLTNDEIVSKINQIGKKYGVGRLGVSAKNFVTGETIQINADSLFPTASVIKVPILVELFYKFEEGKLKKDTLISFDDSLKYGGSGVLQYFYDGAKLKLIDVAVLMIILSDNTATNLVLDCFADEHDAKLEAVNNRMKELGLNNTKILNKLMSFKTKKKTPEAMRFGVGYTTPNDMVKLLELLANGKVINPEISAEIINIMKNNQDYEMMKRYLSENVTVANKSGSIDKMKADIGIVYAKCVTYAVAIFCDELSEVSYAVDNKGHLAVAEISKLIFDYFTKGNCK